MAARRARVLAHPVRLGRLDATYSAFFRRAFRLHLLNMRTMTVGLVFQ